MNSSDAQPREAAPRQSSIVAHRWFPKMIGLWFAALFGLCSLALAPELLERIVTTLGIDKIVPAAAPPLGQTARLLLALGMAGVGEIAGLLIGARLAAGKRTETVRRRSLKTKSETDTVEEAPHLRNRDRHPDAPARKPLSAMSDLRDTDLRNDRGETAGGIETALRRRARASEADHEPRPFIEAAPLPGGEWQPSLAEVENAPVRPAGHPIVQAAHEPMFAEPEPGAVFDLAQFEAQREAEPEAEPAPFEAPFAAPFAVPSATFVEAFIADEPKMPPMLSAGPAPAEIAAASLHDLGVVQLSERLALALQARRERRSLQPTVALAVAAPTVSELADAPPPVAVVAEPEVAEPEAIAPEADVFAYEPQVAEEEAVVPAPPIAAYPPPPFAARRLFAPFATDESDHDDDDEMPALARSLAMPRLGTSGPAEPIAESPPILSDLERGLEILARRAPKAAVKPEAPVEDASAPGEAIDPDVATGLDDGEDAEDLTDEVLEEGYSSLLALGSGFQRLEAVRIEEPQSDEIEPVVIFPGQGARAVGEPSSRAPFDTSANAPFARPGTAPAAAPAAPQGEAANQADPDETDRALRAALASLQRISGAR